MALGRREAGNAVFLDKRRKLRLFQIALLDGQCADHLVVRFRDISRARGLRDIRILHLGRKPVDVGDFHAGSLKRIRDERTDDILRCAAGTDRMTADDVQIDLRALAVVFADDHAEAAEAVFQGGYVFFHVVFRVHAEFRDAAAADDRDTLEGAGLDKRRRFDQRVGRTRAKAARVGTGRVLQAGDFRDRLREVAAAALVHVTAGLFGTVDDILDIVLCDPCVFHRI